MLNKFFYPLLIIAVSAAISVWMMNQDVVPATVHREAPLMLIDVIEAKRSTVSINVSAQGTVGPRTTTTLVSEVSGLITDVSPAFLPGGFFDKGDMLVQIDDRNYQAELKRAQASVATAQSNLERERGLADYAAQDWKRAQSALNSNKQATNLALRKPQMTEAKANLDFALADLDKREGDLDRTTIRAPYSGIVREKIADVGQFVAAGSQLAKSFAIDIAEIRLPLPDKDLPFLNLPRGNSNSVNQPEVKLTANIGGTTYHWTGNIVRTEGVFDERTRVLYVVAQVLDPYNQQSERWDEPLRIGTFVNAEISGRTEENVIVLPRGVLRTGDQVWTVDSNNKLVANTVDLLRTDENFIYVSKGLDTSQLVCATLLENPLPGTPVRYTHESI